MTCKPLAQVVRELESGNPPADGSGFLGANLSPDEARLVLLPVPWDATTSYRPGTAAAPGAIIAASHQLDLEDAAFGRPYRQGITFLPTEARIENLNRQARPAAERVIAAIENGVGAPAELEQVNQASAEVMSWVQTQARQALDQGKLVGLVGGDHSSPFGLIQSLTRVHPQGFGVLQIDAHHDFRAAYEGFTWSHASIAYNLMENLPSGVAKLVQVGVRDYSREESDYLRQLGSRARCFHDRELFLAKANGISFQEITRRILTELPEKVYVSFDIDGLEPQYCPATGTPVPGGLSFGEATYLIEELAASGRRVIGFDLCEVAPGSPGNDWDANVGARLLYRLCGCLLATQETDGGTA